MNLKEQAKEIVEASEHLQWEINQSNRDRALLTARALRVFVNELLEELEK